MMMPNMVKYPIIMLPILITAAVSGVVGSLIGIAGKRVCWVWIYWYDWAD